MKIILAIGVIGSGKDFYTRKYISENPNERCKELKFALPIREFTGKLVGVNLLDNDIYDTWKKTTENRELLINVGQWLKEATFQSVWVDAICKQFTSDADTFIISDFRFPVEFLTIRNNSFFHELKVHLCDFKSYRYAIKDQISEKLAQWLLSKGFQDGKEWDWQEFTELMNDYSPVQNEIV